MDMQNESIMAYRALLAEIARKKMVVGAKQLRKALRSGAAEHVYLADNADPAITGPLMTQCEQANIPCTWVRSMSDLGHACGIEVGAAAAACVK